MFLLTKKKGLSQISDLDFYINQNKKKANETQNKNKKMNNDID